MISSEPLFRYMKAHGITSYQLGKMGFPMSNYHAIRRGQNISTHTVDMLCTILDCQISDIMEYRKSKE